MDFVGVAPEYVCRMWGGTVSLEEIEDGVRGGKGKEFRCMN